MKTPTIKDRILARQEPSDKITIMHQDWRNLLFLHWEADPLVIQSTLPEGLYVDTFNNKAYIGVTPFYLKNLRISVLPAIPGLSNFPEVNVRTYVFNENGIPGVWFYSLYADKLLAVEAAKLIKLPYRYADMEMITDAGSNLVQLEIRKIYDKNNLTSLFQYKMDGTETFADSETLEFFLVERYFLFNYFPDTATLGRMQVHHKPYPLCNAQLLKWDSNLLKNNNFHIDYRSPVHVIMSPGVDVKIYKLEK